MHYFDHRWFTFGILIAIALFATVSALANRILFARHFATVLVGPVIAAVAVIAFMTVAGRPRGKLK
jgi:hypothetical protein